MNKDKGIENIPSSNQGLSLYDMIGVVTYDRCRLVDTNGRPLAELYAHPQTLAQAKQEGHLFQLEPSKLDGRREGIDTNISAYEDIRQKERINALLDNLMWIHDHFLAVETTGAQKRDMVIGLMFRAAAIPMYIINRAENPYRNGEKPLPVEVADLVKVTEGYIKMLPALGTDREQEDQYLTGENAAKYAEDNNILIDYGRGKRRANPIRGCPAPEKMIATTFNGLFGIMHSGGYKPDALNASLQKFNIDLNNLDQFAQALGMLKGADLHLENELFRAQEMRARKANIMFSVREAARNYLDTVITCQNMMNQALERDTTTLPPLTFNHIKNNDPVIKKILDSLNIKINL